MRNTMWWARVVVAAGLGLGTAVAAVWTTSDQPAPPDPIPAPRAAGPEPTDLPKGAIARLGSAAFRHPGEVHGLAFATDGRRLAAVGPAAVSAWAVPDGRVVVAVGDREKGYRHLTVTSPDGRVAVELFNREEDAEKGTLDAARVT